MTYCAFLRKKKDASSCFRFASASSCFGNRSAALAAAAYVTLGGRLGLPNMFAGLSSSFTLANLRTNKEKRKRR